MNPRELFFDRVYDAVKAGEDIVLVTPDLAAPSLDKFRRDYPDRYISVGVAEQSLISTSAGLALGGKKVVAWGLNPFMVTRALDQIRNTVSLMNIPVVFAGLHTGLSSAISGPTHVVITDLTLIRTCENITTYNPSDCGICKDMFDDALRFEKACYLRFDKDITYEIMRDSIAFDDGFSVVREGAGPVVVTTGYHVGICTEMIDSANSGCTVIDVFRLPCNKKRLAEVIGRHNSVVTVEEHVLQGGFSSFVLETMADNGVVLPVKRAGIDMEHGYPEFFGRRNDLERYFGLDKKGLLKLLEEVV